MFVLRVFYRKDRSHTPGNQDKEVGTENKEKIKYLGGGEIFCTRPDWPWGPPRLLYNGYRVSLPSVRRLGRGVDHPPHLEPMLKKE